MCYDYGKDKQKGAEVIMQIGNFLRFKDEPYYVIARTSKVFDPPNYGFKEITAHYSACWTGYVNHFRVEHNKLLLDKLLINVPDKYAKILNGDKPYKGSEMKNTPFNLFDWNYLNVNLPLPFTGRILGGYNYVPYYAIEMGFHTIASYKRIYEFIFDEGRLVVINDYSDKAEEQRKYIDLHLRKGPKGNHKEESIVYDIGRQKPLPNDLEKYYIFSKELVDCYFSLDYKDKADWIKL